MDGSANDVWNLRLLPSYLAGFERLPTKYQSQVARAVQDLALRPQPGGSRRAVSNAPGFVAVSVGEFRVVYRYGDETVELVTVIHGADDFDPMTVDDGGPRGWKPVEVLGDLVQGAALEATGPMNARPSCAGGPFSPTPVWSVAGLTRYAGNVLKKIGKEARYTAKLNGTIQLVLGIGRRESEILTVDDHPELWAMVDGAKRGLHGGQGGGGFWINEYRHVLVPDREGGAVCAGVYTRDLEFVTEDGTLVSPVAPRGIEPGDIWPGPHVGAKYTLSADGQDIRYERQTSTTRFERVCLSDLHGTAAISELLRGLGRVKRGGGALYVNEARELFAPVPEAGEWVFRYLGSLGGAPWFDEPTIGQA